MRKLDIGSGGRRLPGYETLDRDPKTIPDYVHDLCNPLPFEDNYFDEVRAHHILEHIPTEKKTFVMHEIWRVLKLGGVADIALPAFPHVQAVMDPTHLSLWCRESFMYYDTDCAHHKAFVRRSSEPVPAFRVLESAQEGFVLSIRLQAVK